MANVVTKTKTVPHRVPNALISICAKAMNPEKGIRYGNVAELIADLEAWKLDQSVESYRETLVEAVSRFIRNNVPLTVSSVVVTLIGITSAALISTSLHDAENKKMYAMQLRKESVKLNVQSHLQLGTVFQFSSTERAMSAYADALKAAQPYPELQTAPRKRLELQLAFTPKLVSLASHQGSAFLAPLIYDDAPLIYEFRDNEIHFQMDVRGRWSLKHNRHRLSAKYSSAHPILIPL